MLLWMLLLTSLTTSSASAQSSPLRFLDWTYQDAKALALKEGPGAAPYALVGGAVLLSATPLDAPLSTGAEELRGGPMAPYLDVANSLGDNHTLYPVAGLFGLSMATGNTRLQDAAFTSLQSLIYTRLVGDAVKSVVGRLRPTANAGAYAFQPLSGPTSFPSGHTASAFAIVTPWVLYYPSLPTYGLLALSTGTAVARVVRQHHWPTDVVTGAALGTLIGSWLARRHMEHAAAPGPQVQFTPLVSPEGMGLHLRLSLE